MSILTAPVPSLVEYGVWGLQHNCSYPSKWHHAFPNIIRLSIRASPPVLISLFDSLSGQACRLDIVLHVEVGRPFHIPLIFADVRHSYQMVCDILTCILGPGTSFVKVCRVPSRYLFT